MQDWLYRAAAAGVVWAHLGFIVFVITGGVWVWRRPRWLVLHIPAVLWACYVEFSGRICPLTPLENLLRQRAGLATYSGDFIGQHVLPLIYPIHLTREIQMGLGALVLVLNGAVYGHLLWCTCGRGKDAAEVRRA